MPAAVVFIVAALVLYTLAIWTEKFSGHLKTWLVAVFALGFSCDLIGTSMMFWRAADRFAPNMHMICGYIALLIMFLHLAWALLALRRSGNYEKYFTRFSVFAWLVWLAAFFSGMPK